MQGVAGIGLRDEKALGRRRPVETRASFCTPESFELARGGESALQTSGQCVLVVAWTELVRLWRRNL